MRSTSTSLAAPKFELLLKTRLYNLSSEHIIVYSLKSDLKVFKILSDIPKNKFWNFFFLKIDDNFFEIASIQSAQRHTYTLLFDVDLSTIQLCKLRLTIIRTRPNFKKKKLQKQKEKGNEIIKLTRVYFH